MAKYLAIQDVKQGYLIQYSFNKEKTYTAQTINYADKEIFEIVV